MWWSHFSTATLRCNTQSVFIMPRFNRGAITVCIVNVLDQHAILVLYTVHLSKIRIMSLIGVVTGRETPRLWSSCLCCCGQPNTPTTLSPRQNPGWRDWGQPPAPGPVTSCDPWSHPLQHFSDSLTQESKTKWLGHQHPRMVQWGYKLIITPITPLKDMINKQTAALDSMISVGAATNEYFQ